MYGTAPAEQPFYVPPCISVPDREIHLLTHSHFKLNSLDDTQELLETSHHKITFGYDENTTSLVKDPILATAEILLSNDLDSSAGNAIDAPKDYCYEIEADEP